MTASWLDLPAHHPFGLATLPYGVFSTSDPDLLIIRPMAFRQDGDTVTVTGWAPGPDGSRIGDRPGRGRRHDCTRAADRR